MAIGIVDLFEVIDINEQNRERSVVSGGSFASPDQDILEVSVVIYSG